jgi:hypothetical protein
MGEVDRESSILATVGDRGSNRQEHICRNYKQEETREGTACCWEEKIRPKECWSS